MKWVHYNSTYTPQEMDERSTMKVVNVNSSKLVYFNLCGAFGEFSRVPII